MLAGPLYAKVDNTLLSRCRWIKKGVMVYKNYATDICITEDGEYVVVDPPVPEVLERPLAFMVFRGALPPDDREYDKAFKDAVATLAPKGLPGHRWRRDMMGLYREHRDLIHFLLDRWTGRGEYGGYGALEALARDDYLTEIVVPQPLAPPARWTELPRDPQQLLDSIYNEAVELGRFRRVWAVRNDLRMPTNVVVPEAYMPLFVKKLIPALTLERPFQTKEDAVYRLRIAADLLEYNVNIRKMSEQPRPSPKLLSPYVAKAVASNAAAPRAADYADPKGPEIFAMATIAMEARWTVIFSGAMGTGKTTQLNMLLYFTPPWYQVVIVERGAREVWAPLEGQILHISVPSEDKLTSALDQALRYGTMDTIVALAEARTSPELRRLVEYKLTGHGGVTTAHADTIDDILLRIYQSGAPPEALSNTLILQLGVSGGRRYLKEWRALIAKEGKVAEASPGEVLALLEEYTKAVYETTAAEEIKLRAEFAKAVAAKELMPEDARSAVLRIFGRRQFDFADAEKYGYSSYIS